MEFRTNKNDLYSTTGLSRMTGFRARDEVLLWNIGHFLRSYVPSQDRDILFYILYCFNSEEMWQIFRIKSSTFLSTFSPYGRPFGSTERVLYKGLLQILSSYQP